MTTRLVRTPWLMAGLVYFAVVFLAGFALGTIRTLWLAPAIGQFPGVAIELPFMLAASWFACGWCLGKFQVSSQRARACMGAVAFFVLMMAEAVLAVAAFGMRLQDYAAGFVTAAGMLGLVGQAAFAAMPLFHPDARRTTGSRQEPRARS